MEGVEKGTTFSVAAPPHFRRCLAVLRVSVSPWFISFPFHTVNSGFFRQQHKRVPSRRWILLFRLAELLHHQSCFGVCLIYFIQLRKLSHLLLSQKPLAQFCLAETRLVHICRRSRSAQGQFHVIPHRA